MSTDPAPNPRHPGNPRTYEEFANSVQIGMGWDDFLILTRPEVQDAVNQALESSFLGKAPVEDAFKEADTKINKVLVETGY